MHVTGCCAPFARTASRKAILVNLRWQIVLLLLVLLPYSCHSLPPLQTQLYTTSISKQEHTFSSPPPQTGEDDLPRIYFTWNTPEWGRFGNQKLLVMFAHKLSLMTGWIAVPPPITLGCIRFVNGKRIDVPFWLDDAFDMRSDASKSVLNLSFDLSIRISKTQFESLPNIGIVPSLPSDDEIWEVLHKKKKEIFNNDLLGIETLPTGLFQFDANDLWIWGNPGWIAQTHRFTEENPPPLWAVSAAHLFNSPGWITQQTWHEIIKMNSFIADSVAIHIRSGDVRHVCSSYPVWLYPSRWVDACDLAKDAGLQAVLEAVNELTQFPDQPVVLVTNMHKHTEFTDALRTALGDRLRELEYGRMLELGQFCYLPMLDSLVLSHAAAVTGTRFSSYMTTIAAQRNFFQTKFTRVGTVVSWPRIEWTEVFYMALLFGYVYILRSWCMALGSSGARRKLFVHVVFAICGTVMFTWIYTLPTALVERVLYVVLMFQNGILPVCLSFVMVLVYAAVFAFLWQIWQIWFARRRSRTLRLEAERAHVL